MASKRTLAAILILGGAVTLVAAQDAAPPKPLVRKDLLVFGKVDLAPPVRDIFRPKTSAAPAKRPVRPSVKPAPGAPEPEAPPSFALNISYVGSVKAGGATIALVLKGGQTLSVSQGDEVAPGYKVIRVTAQAIIVRGPTGETRTFAKQGDRP